MTNRFAPTVKFVKHSDPKIGTFWELHYLNHEEKPRLILLDKSNIKDYEKLAESKHIDIIPYSDCENFSFKLTLDEE